MNTCNVNEYFIVWLSSYPIRCAFLPSPLVLYKHKYPGMNFPLNISLSRKHFVNIINKFEISQTNPQEPRPGVPLFRKYMQCRLKILDTLSDYPSSEWPQKCQRMSEDSGAHGPPRRKQKWRGGKGTNISLSPTLSQVLGQLLLPLISFRMMESTGWLWRSWLMRRGGSETLHVMPKVTQLESSHARTVMQIYLTVNMKLFPAHHVAGP